MADQTKTQREELELRLSTTLAPMLLTLATFSLGIASTASASTPSNTLIDGLLSPLAGFCIFASALLIDFVLDKQKLSLDERLKYLNRGYLAFCVVVGAMTTLCPILYKAHRAGPSGLAFDKSFVWFIGAGLSVVLKLMTLEDRSVWTAFMLIFYAAAIYSVL